MSVLGDLGLVEILAGPKDPPDDLDILTESTEQDSWMKHDPSPRPDDLDIETKAVEQDAWHARGPEDLDIITRSGAERDRWAAVGSTSALEPRPKPTPHPDDLDVETFTDNESDSWI
jgi:hypothetical protein